MYYRQRTIDFKILDLNPVPKQKKDVNTSESNKKYKMHSLQQFDSARHKWSRIQICTHLFVHVFYKSSALYKILIGPYFVFFRKGIPPVQ